MRILFSIVFPQTYLSETVSFTCRCYQPRRTHAIPQATRRLTFVENGFDMTTGFFDLLDKRTGYGKSGQR
jgi:hypothetical protein